RRGQAAEMARRLAQPELPRAQALRTRMSTFFGSAGTYDAPRRDWVRAAVAVAIVGVVGVMLGVQIMTPNKRVLAVMAAVVVCAVGGGASVVMGLGFLLLALPFRGSRSFGSTTLAFILILLVIWLLRMSQRVPPWPQRPPADAPIIGLVIAYVISFY